MASNFFLARCVADRSWSASDTLSSTSASVGTFTWLRSRSSFSMAWPCNRSTSALFRLRTSSMASLASSSWGYSETLPCRKSMPSLFFSTICSLSLISCTSLRTSRRWASSTTPRSGSAPGGILAPSFLSLPSISRASSVSPSGSESSSHDAPPSRDSASKLFCTTCFWASIRSFAFLALHSASSGSSPMQRFTACTANMSSGLWVSRDSSTPSNPPAGSSRPHSSKSSSSNSCCALCELLLSDSLISSKALTRSSMRSLPKILSTSSHWVRCSKPSGSSAEEKSDSEDEGASGRKSCECIFFFGFGFGFAFAAFFDLPF
mmetsp:Transcript_46841/g.134050  ORF Transcript_46841/g.134050 Transcript_46841/m.134050 type:complete len:320 (-) Transcript_46841:205-1164(-)